MCHNLPGIARSIFIIKIIANCHTFCKILIFEQLDFKSLVGCQHILKQKKSIPVGCVPTSGLHSDGVGYPSPGKNLGLEIPCPRPPVNKMTLTDASENITFLCGR